MLVDPVETTSLLTLAAFERAAEALLGVPVSVLTPDCDNTVWQLTEGHRRVCEEVMVARTTGRLQAKHVSAAAEAVEAALKE